MRRGTHARGTHAKTRINNQFLISRFSIIIAATKIKDGCVITEEALKPNAPKIPTVCQHFSIDCTNVQGLMEREGWQF